MKQLSLISICPGGDRSDSTGKSLPQLLFHCSEFNWIFTDDQQCCPGVDHGAASSCATKNSFGTWTTKPSSIMRFSRRKVSIPLPSSWRASSCMRGMRCAISSCVGRRAPSGEQCLSTRSRFSSRKRRPTSCGCWPQRRTCCSTTKKGQSANRIYCEQSSLIKGIAFPKGLLTPRFREALASSKSSAIRTDALYFEPSSVRG